MNKQGKVGVWIITIILAGLIMTNAIVLISNLKFQDNKFGFQSPLISKVVVTEDFMSDMKGLYRGEENEFVVCLEGKFFPNDKIIIEEHTLAESINSSEVSVEFVGCTNPKTIIDNAKEFFQDEDAIVTQIIGTVQRQPQGLCVPSPQDYFTFGELDHYLLGVMCREDRIVFYTPHDLIKSVEVEIV